VMGDCCDRFYFRGFAFATKNKNGRKNRENFEPSKKHCPSGQHQLKTYSEGPGRPCQARD